MLKRNQNNTQRRWLTVGAVIVGGALSWLGLWSLSQYQAAYVYQQQAKSAERKEVASSRCYTILGANTLCSQNHEAAAADAERSDDDLHAQQDMAEWAKWITFLTGFQVVVGAFGIYFVARTLDKTTEAVSTAHEANETARHLAAAELRAYVGVSTIKVEIHPHGRWIKGTVTMRNSGQTPARNVRGFHGWALEPPPFKEEWLAVEVGNFGSILPGGEMIANTLATDKADDPSKQITPDQVHKSIKGDGLRFWIYGRIEYEDVFGEAHWTTFRHALKKHETLEPAMVPTTEGNDGN